MHIFIRETEAKLRMHQLQCEPEDTGSLLSVDIVEVKFSLSLFVIDFSDDCL